jgi:hypothetical protein
VGFGLVAIVVFRTFAEKNNDNMDNKEKRKKKATEGEHKRPWREVYATVEDIQNFLMDRVLLRHNGITRRVECRIPDSMPCSAPQPPRSALPLGSSKNFELSYLPVYQKRYFTMAISIQSLFRCSPN